MKKIFTIIILSAIMAFSGFSQSASITIENPRINDGKFLWDVYIMRTTDWSVNQLGDCSWYWNFNITDLTNYTIVEENTDLFGPDFSNSIDVIGGQLRINTVYTLPTPVPTFPNILDLNVWYKAFTCSADITGPITNETDMTWDQVNTGLTDAVNASITETYFDSDCDIALNTNCWTGAISGDWDQGGNWSLGTPPTTTTTTMDVIYPRFDSSPTGPYDLLGMNTNAFTEVNNLRINHDAQLTIPIGRTIVVNGSLLLKGDTNLVLPGGSGVGTLSTALITDNINYNAYTLEAGHIEVHRTLYYEDTEFDYYHHQVAAPVDNVSLGDWDMIHGNSYAYEFQADQNWFNIYEPSRSTDPGYGFLLSLFGDPTGSTSTQDVVFYDNLVLGTVNPATAQGDGNLSLIGNPYTAPIFWNTVYDASSGVVNSVWIWDPDGGNYTSASTAGGNQSAQYIQPGQAFFVQALGASTNIVINPDARSTNIQDYLKSSIPNHLVVYTEGGNSTHDKTYIRFMDSDAVSGSYEVDFDVVEWPSTYGEDATELFTVSADNQNLIVDVRPLSPDLMSVPLSFKAAVEAEYTIGASIESIESFSPGTDIFLEDTHMPGQAWIDLREFPEYTFNATPQDDYARFIVHFHIQDFGIDELSEKPISIFGERTDAIITNNSGQRINEIQVFDITGNLIMVKTGITDQMTRMFVNNNTGYYVVKVITDKAVYSEKVLITK